MSLSVISEEIRRSKTQEEALHRAYDLVTRHFQAGRLNTYLKLWLLFRRDLGKVWQRGGFAHCTHLNATLRLLLIESGQFRPQDITTRWTLVSYWSPHQYLCVHVKDGRVIEVDPWGRSYGVPFGKHGVGFNATLFRVKMINDKS